MADLTTQEKLALIRHHASELNSAGYSMSLDHGITHERLLATAERVVELLNSIPKDELYP